MNFKKRIKNLQNLITRFDSVLITSPHDIYYYTGFAGADEFTFLIVNKKDKPKLLTSPLNNEAENLKTAEISFIKKITDLTKELKGKVGYDEYNLNAKLFSVLKKIKLKPASTIIKKPRLIKESQEIEKIKKAVKITKNTLKKLKIYGKSEKMVSNEILLNFRKSGAGYAFCPSIGAGKNSFFIHHVPTEKIIRKNDLVMMDVGAKFDHYCSDITRTYFSGTDKKKAKILVDVKNMQEIIIDMLKPGMKFEEIQAAYVKLMKKTKYEILHAVSHSVGLETHERFTVLEKNMIITVEPGVYIKNLGGARIEDTILIKNKAYKL